MTIKFTDRYSASGRPRPDPATVCEGECEGMGFFPSNNKAEWPPGAKPDAIGYVFVTCHTCGGTGRRDGGGTKLTPAERAKAVKRIKRAIRGR